MIRRVQKRFRKIRFTVVLGDIIADHKSKKDADRRTYDDKRNKEILLCVETLALIEIRLVITFLDFVGNTVKTVSRQYLREKIRTSAVAAYSGKVDPLIDWCTAVFAFTERSFTVKLDQSLPFYRNEGVLLHVDIAEERKFQINDKSWLARDFGKFFAADPSVKGSFKIAGIKTCIADEFSRKQRDKKHHDRIYHPTDRPGHSFCVNGCVDVIAIIDEKTDDVICSCK